MKGNKKLQRYCKFTTFAFLTMNTKINWDMMGIATSIACAIHCALLPVLVSTLPVFGINIVHNSIFEWGMIVLAFIVGSYSLFHGYVKHHHSLNPVLNFSAGFLFLVLKQFFHFFDWQKCLFLCRNFFQTLNIPSFYLDMHLFCNGIIACFFAVKLLLKLAQIVLMNLRSSSF